MESVNYILKKGYNGHCARGGGAGKSVVERDDVEKLDEGWETTSLVCALIKCH